MKKFLLLILTMLCVSIGTWADVTITWNSGTNTATVSSTSSDVDFPWNTYWQILRPNVVFTGDFTNINWVDAASKVNNGNQTNARFDISDATGISVTNLATLISSQQYNLLDNVTRFVLPAGTAIPSDVSGLNHGGKLQYIYVKDGSDQPNVYLTSNVTAGTDLSYEFTATEIENIKTNGIKLSGNETAIGVIRDYLVSQGVDANKITQPYNGVAVATAGSVQSGVEASYTAGGGTAEEVTTLTVNTGTLSDADVSYITGQLTGLTSLDISAATATGDQIFNLLNGTPTGCAITLSDAQKTALKGASGKTYTTAMLAKAGFSATSFMSGMTTKNYIISGTTLHVTGELASEDASIIKKILDANSSIKTLDVSKCTSSSGTVNINDDDWLSANITTVSIPSGGFITYTGSQATPLTAGAVTIDIPTNYTTIADAVASTDLQSLISGNSVDYLKVTGTLTSEDLGNLHSLGSGTGFSSVKSIDVSSVTLASGAEWTSISQSNASWGNASVLMPRGTDVTAFENCMANVQSISVDGQTLSIQVNDAPKLTNDAITANNSGASKLIVYDGKSSASDKNAAGSAAITALRQFEGFHLLDMTHAADQSATLTGLTNFDIVLSPISSGKLTVLGTTLTNEMLQTISALTSTITAIDFSNVTSVASDLDWNNLTASASLSGLASLTLPKGTELTTAEARKLTTNFSSLMYAYSPTTKNRTRAEQDVADYVYVIRPGGLNQAMTDESDLRKAVYVKIVSDVGNNVALSTTDANFGGHDITSETSYTSGGDDYPWQFIDLSGTIVTAAATIANTAPYTDKGYRIILPSNLTGDNMAIFASKPITDDGKGRGYRGIPAAVYSYKGTTLNILEIADASYLPTALADDRIVRDGTTEVSIISGVFGSNTYFNFGDNLRQAINGAKDCVETVTIEVPYSGGATLTIDNDHLKTVSMEGVSNSTVALDVDGCATLETLNLSEATFSKATAQNITTLKEVDLRNTTFSGTKDTSTGEGCINLTNSLHSGLEITYVTGFDTGRIIPAAASTYFNAIAQANLDVSCAGSTLESNMPAVLTAKEGTDGKDPGTYRNRDITVLHVTGTLTSADINFIVNNLTRLELLDLKGASYGDGVSGETLVNALYGNGMSDIALIFPTNNTKASEGAGTVNQHEVWYATTLPYQMKCVGYFADEDEYKTDLHVFGTDENVGKLAAIVPDSGDDLFYQFSVTFEPKYQSDPALGYNAAISAGTYNWGVYPNATDKFVSEGLSRLPANTIDLTFMNISTVKNLASLNENTHFVVVPTTGQYFNDSEDVTKTGTDDGDTKYYHFPNSVYGISTLKGSTWPLSSSCRFNGRNYDFSTTGPIGRALLTYITPSGEGNITETVGEFINSNLPAIDRYVGAGTFDNNAITALQHITAKEMDLSGATVTDENMLAFRNTTVEYLALPDGKNALINASKVDAMDDASFNYKDLTSLKAIGAYDPSNDDDDTTLPTYTVHSTVKTVTATSPLTQENSVYKITSMCAPNASRTAGSATGLPKVVMSGYLTKADIMNNGVEAGLSGDNSLANANMKNAVFLNNEDMTYSRTWQMAPLRAIVLPDDSRQTLIPKNCLNGAQITELCITHNYKKIDNAAFHNSTLNHITATDGKGALIDNGDHTFTLPGSLEEIGTKPEGECNTIELTLTKTLKDEETVFPHGRNITDVYVLALKTPKCYKNAFPADILYGWGGFDGTLPYCRDKYHNNTDWFSVLRYPSRESYEAKYPASSSARQTDMEFEEDEDEPMAGVQKAPASRRAPASINLSDGIDSYDEMKAAYTDVNKVYTKKEQTGAVDANGEEITWPTFSEMKRVYNQATLELTWNDWNVEYFDEGDVRQVNGGVNPVARGGGTGVIDASEIGTDKIEGGSLNGDYDFTDYEGWHQFVLAQATYVEPDEVTPETRNYVDAGWFTICIPYNLTIKQVREWLGVPASEGNVHCYYNNAEVTTPMMPDIRQLYSVERYESNGSDNNKVTFRLTPNLYNNGTPKVLTLNYNENGASRYPANISSYEDAGSGDGDDKVCLRGGTPYIIHVYKREGEVIKSYNLGKYLMTRYGDKFKETASCIRNGEPYYEYLGAAETAVGDQLVTLKFAKPYELHQIQAMDEKPEANYLEYNDGGTMREYRYALVGQFWDQKLPKYCIYQSKGQWYRNSTDNNFKWAAYKCVIMAIPTITSPNVAGHMGEGFRLNGETVGNVYADKSFYPSIESGTTDLLNGTLSIVFSDGRDDDDFNNSSSARGYAFDFDNADMSMEYDDEDGNTTTIDCLDGEDLRPSNDKVYSMTGQYMGNSLEGLSKGIYIVNGKKVYVK